MIGDEATIQDGDPHPVERDIAESSDAETLQRAVAPFPNSPPPADLSWLRTPSARHISLLAWAVAGGIGILLWVVIFKLLF